MKLKFDFLKIIFIHIGCKILEVLQLCSSCGRAARAIAGHIKQPRGHMSPAGHGLGIPGLDTDAECLILINEIRIHDAVFCLNKMPGINREEFNIYFKVVRGLYTPQIQTILLMLKLLPYLFVQQLCLVLVR